MVGIKKTRVYMHECFPGTIYFSFPIEFFTYLYQRLQGIKKIGNNTMQYVLLEMKKKSEIFRSGT